MQAQEEHATSSQKDLLGVSLQPPPLYYLLSLIVLFVHLQLSPHSNIPDLTFKQSHLKILHA